MRTIFVKNSFPNGKKTRLERLSSLRQWFLYDGKWSGAAHLRNESAPSILPQEELTVPDKIAA